MTGVLIQSGDVYRGMHIQGKCCVKTEGRDGVVTPSSEGTPKIDSNYQKLGETARTDILTSLRGNHPCQCLTLRLLASSTVRW